MHKKLSFITLLSLFLLNFNISPLIAAGTDHLEKQEQLVSDLENQGSSSCDLVKDEN